MKRLITATLLTLSALSMTAQAKVIAYTDVFKTASGTIYGIAKVEKMSVGYNYLIRETPQAGKPEFHEGYTNCKTAMFNLDDSEMLDIVEGSFSEAMYDAFCLGKVE